MGTVLWQVAVWYAVVQLLALAVLPLALHVGRELPDRGLTLSKVLGILLTGVVLWLGVSYGVLRNERGGAWLAVLLVTATAWSLPALSGQATPLTKAELRRLWPMLVVSETIFAAAFLVWAMVRALDPAANHTEQPMDLMFMNSIWASPTYPPQDAWFAGYAISYYYLGYWLLVTVGRLAEIPPNVAYNVGQACWYGLLWLGAFGVTVNLLAAHRRSLAGSATQELPRFRGRELVTGLFASIAVAATGNLQVILEWLYAQGAPIEGLARWIGVYNFPDRAMRTGQWFISLDWWWWRSSRVVEDLDLFGNHIEVIDEFPAFSYLLGDNHPHVLAMPVVLLVIGLALDVYLGLARAARTTRTDAWFTAWPGGVAGMVILVVATGSLVFLNTWDFPPYWALLAAVAGSAAMATGGRDFAWSRTVVVGLALAVGTVVVYFPYFLTAQSQAGGVIPNLFYPTRLTQFIVMFGGFMPALAALLVLAWRQVQPTRQATGTWVAAILGGAMVVLATAATTALTTDGGRALLSRVALPDGMTYGGAILQRWSQQPWTLLLTAGALGITGAVFFAAARSPLAAGQAEVSGDEAPSPLPFVLLLLGLGLTLVALPEVVYLRDNFGTRMNTIFKFYYQAWLLFALVSAYAVGMVFSGKLPAKQARFLHAPVVLSVLLVMAGVLFPIAGVYSKTGGLRTYELTLDATDYIRREAPDVAAAVQWVAENTAPGTIVLEGKGASYRAAHNRFSTATGRPTLLGWDGHQAQWRGEAYGVMARGRPEAIERIYRTGTPAEVVATLAEWNIGFVVIGPSEVEQYGITESRIAQLRQVLEPVFVSGQVVILRPRAALGQ